MAEDEVIVAKKVEDGERASVGKITFLVVVVVGALAGILFAAINASNSPSTTAADRPPAEQTEIPPQ